MHMYPNGNGPVQGGVSGRAARARLSASALALLAVDIRQGRASYRPTIHELEAMLGVSASYIVLAGRIADDPVARAKIRIGISLAEVVGQHAPHPTVPALSAGNGANGANGGLLDQMVELWGRMTPEERAGLARRVGPGVLWDESVLPAIS